MTYANVAMTLALVFAMTGGAFAAKDYVITSTGQIKPNVLKHLRGRRGPRGPQGKPGPAGAGAAAPAVGVRSAPLKAGDKNCPAGGSVFVAANGTTYACNGEEGSAGRNGTNGVNGASVTATPVPVGDSARCNAIGGSEFSVGDTTTFACNGESVMMKQLAAGEGGCQQGGEEFTVGDKKGSACNGFEGKDGSPWTAGGTLPSGQTEAGTWAFAAHSTGAVMESMSYTIPLASALQGGFVIASGEEGKEHATECPGTLMEPKAAAGYLCVYTAPPISEEPTKSGSYVVGTVITSFNSGGTVLFLVTALPTEPPYSTLYGTLGRGTWAVTAE